MLQYWDQLLLHLDRSRKVKASRVEQILQKEPQWADRPEQMLVDHHLISKDELLAVKSAMMNVPAVNVDVRALDPSVVCIVPQAMAQRYKAVCVERDGSSIILAMVDPNDAFALDYVQMRTGYEVVRRVAYAGDVEAVIQKLYAGGPPMGRAPGSIRERIGMEVVRGRSMDAVPLARPRVIELADDLTETARAKPTVVAADGPSLRGGSGGAVGVQRQTAGIPRLSSTGEKGGPRSGAADDRIGLELARLSLDLIGEQDEDALIDKMLDTAMRLFHIDAASLLLIDWERSQLYFREARGPGHREVLELALPLDPDSSVAAWCVAHRQPANIADAARDPRHCQEVDRQLGYTTRSLLAAPVIWGQEVLGVVELLNKQEGPFSQEDVELVTIMAAQVAQALHNTMAMRQLHNFYQQSIETLIDCYQAFDPVSRHHVVNVASLATSIGRELGVSGEDMETLSYAGLLHDIGKLRCAEPSDPRHAELGASTLQQVTLFHRLIPAVQYHHERYDGSGPSGLAGDAIPPLARILAVAESWCEEALCDLRAGADYEQILHAFRLRFGTDFDPALRAPFDRSVQVAVL